MKLFFISDVHGNQFALKRILSYAREEINADMIFCLGDISGYLTGINEVVELLKEYEVKTILGNHDAFLLDTLPIDKNKPYYSSFLKTKQTISPEAFNWLRGLKESMSVTIGNFKMELYHGGPSDLLNQYVYPDRLRKPEWVFSNSDCFAFGHTHLQFGVKLFGKIFINPGSIGLPRNGDYRAHGILYDVSTKELSEHRVKYDLNVLLDYYKKDESVNPIFLHNVHFGRSSSKKIKDNVLPFLSGNIVDTLNARTIKTINTSYGAIIFYDDSSFSNLLYIASFEDGTIELTSSTLSFKWENHFFNKNNADGLLNVNLAQNPAGSYLRLVYENMKLFDSNILNDIENAIELMKKYELKNVKN